MADTFSLRFEIDASRAEAGAKKFNAAINSVTKSLSGLDAKGEAAFSKLMGASTGNFSKLAKDLSKLNDIKINPAAVKNINSLGTAFRNLKAPSPALIKNLTNFATVVPALLNSFNVSGNFAESVNKIGTALNGLKVPSPKKLEGLKTFADGLKSIAPSLKIVGNFSGIEKLGTAMGGFRAPSEKAVTNMRAFFNALNISGSKAAISGSLVSGIVNLSAAMGGLKSPSGTAVKNLRDLFNTLATFKPVSGTGSVAKITAAFSGFKGPTQAQTKNLKDFVTMLANLKVPSNVGAIAGYLERIGQAATRANGSLHNFRTNLNGIGFRGVGQNVQGLTTNLRGLENAFSGTFQAASVFRALIGSITLGTLSKALYEANVNFLAFKSTLLAVNNNDLKATGDEMRYVEDMANRLGQRVNDIQESFGGFTVSSKLAGVSTEDTRKIFEATVTAMTVLHRSSDRTKLALLALEQMMSKGKVSSEELRRQLGEQLPGSVNLMARALGVGADKLSEMMKKGEVYSNEALPKFAKEIEKTYGPALAASLGNAVSQFNLLSNAINSLFVVAGQNGIMESLASAFERIKVALSSKEFLTFAAEFGQRTGVVIEKLSNVFVYLVQNIDTVINVLKILLAINIARFFQGFAAMALGSIANVGALATSFGLLKTAITGVTTTAAGVATSMGMFSRVGALLTGLGTGPIGLVITALGVLATAWYTTREKAIDFTEALDTSEEAFGRYADRVATFSIGQLTAEQGTLEAKILSVREGVSEISGEVQKFIQLNTQLNEQSFMGGSANEEMDQLIGKYREAQFQVGNTVENITKFARSIANVKFDTEAANSFKAAVIGYADAATHGATQTEIANKQLEIIQNTLNGANSGNAVSAFKEVASAASDMAGVVASAAADVANAFAQMNMSRAQIAMAKDFQKLDDVKNEKLAAAANLSFGDRKEYIADLNAEYTKSRSELNRLAKAQAGVNEFMDKRTNAQNNIEKYGDGATEASRKAAKLKEDLAAVNKEMGYTDSQKAFTKAGLQTEYDDWVKSQAKKDSKGKGKGGSGGALGKLLDEDGKATAQYRKEQELLNKALDKGKITQDQYSSAMENLKAKYAGTTAGLQGFNAEFEALRNELMPSNAGLTDFINKQTLLQEALDTGKIKLGEYTELMLRLRKANAEAATGGSGNNFIDGINKGLLDLTKTGEDFTTDIAGVVSNAFGGLEDALTEWVSTGKLDFKALTESILSDISRLVIRYMVIQPIINALSGMMGGGGGGFLSGLLGGGGTDVSPWAGMRTVASAKGNAFSNGNIVPFAKGGLTNGSNNGIVASPTYFEMSGNKTGLMGEAGTEAIMPLKRGADGSLGVSASGAVQATSTNVVVQPQVNVNITGGSGNAQVESKQNPDGSLDINVMLEQIKSSIASDVSKGGTSLNRAFEGRYGANPATGNKR